MGAFVIATASSADKLETARRHGADHVIDYSAGEFRNEVKEITKGGADVIFDPVGGDVFDQSLRCIAWEGRLLAIGFASGRIPQAPANILLVKNIAVIGVHWSNYRERPARTSQAFLRPDLHVDLRREAVVRWSRGPSPSRRRRKHSPTSPDAGPVARSWSLPDMTRKT